MILFFHMFVGALIAAKIKLFPLAVLFAFLSHYFLDFLPHNDYLIDNIQEKKWRKSGLDFLKLALDFGTGLTLIVFVNYLTGIDYFILFIPALFAFLPDVLLFLGWVFQNNRILKCHFKVHNKFNFSKESDCSLSETCLKTNCCGNIKISVWTKIFVQLLVILIGLAVLS